MRLKDKFKWILIIPLILSPVISTPATPVYADEVILKQPSLTINKKGKVDIIDETTGSKKSKTKYVNEFIKKYRTVIAGISGVGAVTMILFFILNFIQIGAWSAEPEKRSEKIRALIFTAIGAAGLGSVTFITGIFFNSL